MQGLKPFLAAVMLMALAPQNAAAQSPCGAKGAEAEPNREQPWLVPSPDPDTPAHAVLFRPAGDGAFRLAVIAHASTQNVRRRAQMRQPEYGPRAAWLVPRALPGWCRNAPAMAPQRENI